MVEKELKKRIKLELKEKFKEFKLNYNYNNPTGDFFYDGKRLSMKDCKRYRNKNYKSPNKNIIHTIGYYGSKRNWNNEFNLIFTYVAKTYNINKLVDIFGGSGILSLIASQNGLYDDIFYNDKFYMVYNYHLVLKDFNSFEKFLVYVSKFSRMPWEKLEEELKLIKKEIKENGSSKVKVRNPNPKKAALYYCLKNHEFNQQGGLIEDKKSPEDFLNKLKETQKLYNKINISSYNYKKVLLEHINTDCLIVLDPPYVKSVRKQKNSYSCELSYSVQYEMLTILTDPTIKAKILLCGYENMSYYHKFKNTGGWHCIQLLKSGSRKKEAPADERIWVNFDIKSLLEEYPKLFKYVY